MAEDLSAPLGRKKSAKSAGKSAAKPGGKPGDKEAGGKKRFAFALPISPDKLPLARAAFGLVAFILVGAALRIFLVNDPNGGRPVAEVDVNSTRNGNTIAQNVALEPASDATIGGEHGGATITALPEGLPSGASVQVIGDDVPDGDPAAAPPTDLVAAASAQGLEADLLEENEKGPLPRVGTDGRTPFDAYRAIPPEGAASNGKPMIALVVTGLGLNVTGTANAIQTLPSAVSLAFAPYGKDLTNAVRSARSSGHEVLLEVPLEPFDYPESDPGPDTLLTGEPPRDNLSKLFSVMARFGGYVGLINHMGARFTASASDFGPLMEELGTRGLGYVDDGSSNRSVAPQLAAANNVEFAKADVPLDIKPTRAAIAEQLKALEDKATTAGSAIGVISALPISVQMLAEWSKDAGDHFNIVPVSALMNKPK